MDSTFVGGAQVLSKSRVDEEKIVVCGGTIVPVTDHLLSDHLPVAKRAKGIFSWVMQTERIDINCKTYWDCEDTEYSKENDGSLKAIFIVQLQIDNIIVFEDIRI